MNLNQLIDVLPKAELHLHIEGTLEPQMMLDLAKRNGVELPYQSVEEVEAAYQFDCLQDFLDVYYQGMSVLIEERDFYELAMAYLQKVHGDGVRHVEMFFDPQAHMERGVSFDTVLNGLAAALKEAHDKMDMSGKLIMCFLRHLSEDEAFDALDCACKHKDHIFAVGLDSSEKGHPPEKFSRVFSKARDEGFIAVAHAGEEGPAEYVRTALDDLRVSRVDHGNSAFDDPALVRRLARDQTPLTMCPLSNLRLAGIPDLSLHPVKKALKAGVLATINSDDPSYFGGYVNDNYKQVAAAVGLDGCDVVKLAQNSFAASFISDTEKQTHFDSIAAQVEKVRKV